LQKSVVFQLALRGKGEGADAEVGISNDRSEIVDLGRSGADGGSDWSGAEQQRALGDERALP
jgi:hypothetical protein